MATAATAPTRDQVTPVLISGADILRLAGWDKTTFRSYRLEGKFPPPLFTRGRKMWWNRKQVMRALGVED